MHFFAHKYLGEVRTLQNFLMNSNLSRYLVLKDSTNEEIYPPSTKGLGSSHKRKVKLYVRIARQRKLSQNSSMLYTYDH